MTIAYGVEEPIIENTAAILVPTFDRRISAIFWLSIGVFCLELIIMVFKYHFLGILCSLAIIAAFFLNYFRERESKSLAWLLILNIVFDITWIIYKTKVRCVVKLVHHDIFGGSGPVDDRHGQDAQHQSGSAVDLDPFDDFGHNSEGKNAVTVGCVDSAHDDV